MIFGAVEAILMIIILISFGFFAAYKKWAVIGTSHFITKLIINITLPCTILNSFLTKFTAEELLSSGKYVLVAFASVLAFYFVGRLVARFANIDKNRRGVFTALFSFSNSVYIGFPVALSVFGEAGMVFAIFYFFANTTCFNTLGFLLIAGDGERMKQEKLLAANGSGLESIPAGSPRLYGDMDVEDRTAPKGGALAMVKRVLQPPIISIAVAILLVMLNVKLPGFLNSVVTYTAGITSPLSLIFVGIIVHRIGFRSLKFEKGLPLVMIGRFLLAPLVMFCFAMLFGIDRFATEVFVVQMALPCMVQTVVYSEACGADSGYATRGMVLSTLVSLVVLPILVIVFG